MSAAEQEKSGPESKRLLLFDLDGTLLTSDKRITDRTLASLWKAREAGFMLGLSTSRGMSNFAKYARVVEPDVIIASSGALVTANGRVIYRNALSADEVNRIIEVSKSIVGEDCKITVDTDDAHYKNYPDENPYFGNTWEGDIYTDYSGWNSEGLKMCVRILDEDIAREVGDNLPFCDYVRFTDEYWYKITKKGITKASAIEKICSATGVKAEDITAFGDDLVDLGMLKLCGRGIAMGNAFIEVKENADAVIGSNDEDGIAEYIENVLLKGECNG